MRVRVNALVLAAQHSCELITPEVCLSDAKRYLPKIIAARGGSLEKTMHSLRKTMLCIMFPCFHVSVSLDNVGDIQAAQGDASAALKSDQQSLLIAEALALADPSNAQAKRDVSYDHQFWENDQNAEFGECHAVEYDA